MVPDCPESPALECSAPDPTPASQWERRRQRQPGGGSLSFDDAEDGMSGDEAAGDVDADGDSAMRPAAGQQREREQRAQRRLAAVPEEHPPEDDRQPEHDQELDEDVARAASQERRAEEEAYEAEAEAEAAALQREAEEQAQHDSDTKESPEFGVAASRRMYGPCCFACGVLRCC